MALIMLDGDMLGIVGYRSADKPPFDKVELTGGATAFLCPDCETDEFQTFSCSICECSSCGRKITVHWE